MNSTLFSAASTGYHRKRSASQRRGQSAGGQGSNRSPAPALRPFSTPHQARWSAVCRPPTTRPAPLPRAGPKGVAKGVRPKPLITTVAATSAKASGPMAAPSGTPKCHQTFTKQARDSHKHNPAWPGQRHKHHVRALAHRSPSVTAITDNGRATRTTRATNKDRPQIQPQKRLHIQPSRQQDEHARHQQGSSRVP